ncbi:uncharacterized protein Z518_08697 [Rhinocladiella mackenziei CBS 650.93]|uniref:F-box domain-containing protein n=1 Tax=Rhinocladiella mackenziei CBS 650.93 TaxID=1442369 RepID=A0A0D2J1G7_9EURO|nr:uncharacterized protein Z518_08697 [Rhinocladiella mackenziei CBS 650.93]KIX02755.1 hypothetical protein Z518_08697 [Rhinocladiella mackenziei CBS 650.93]
MSLEGSISPYLLPPSLLDLLSNTVILDTTLPYLPLSTIFSLSRTSHAFRDLLFQTASVFRYVDLSQCRGAYVPPNLLTRIDSGGHSWRAERMDENLTEDEFYAGPLRGVLWKLRRMKVLQHVQTLVLDELASVTHDLVSDIVLAPEYNVRLLSIRRCLNVNQSKLQQLLRHLCRPSRPEGTPRLQGLYVFTNPVSLNQHAYDYNFVTLGVTISQGAPLGAGMVTADGKAVSNELEPWYAPSGQVISQGHAQRCAWEETLQTCHGIISFDAVLCTHMHVDMAPVLHAASRDYLMENKPGIPPMATVSLGPGGCAGCGRNPHGAPVWGKSDFREFPLLWPPPTTGKLVDAVRPPLRTTEDGRILPQRLIVSCTWCLTNRYCESCHRWWCADCYNPKTSKKLSDLERLSRAGLSYFPSREEIENGATDADGGDHIKVFNRLCVQNCLVGEWMTGAGGGGMWG